MGRRHPLAAVLGVAGLVIGTVAAIAPAATAADELSATTTFSCVVTPVGGSAFKPYDYIGKITLSAGRAEGSSTVTVVATMSKMTGSAPVPLDKAPFTDELVLDVAGAPVTLSGSGTVTAASKADFTMPSLQGTFSSEEASVEVAVTSFAFEVTALGITMNGACSPTAGAALGQLVLTTGSVPTLTSTPTPTTTTTATATPSATSSPTPTPSAGAGGEPAKGEVKFACALSIGSKFDYRATISVAGFRAKEGDDVSLVATMSDLPGIAPVPIEGEMVYTLASEIGGAPVTLTSTTIASSAPNEDVPVSDLSGSSASDEDEMEVAVSAFTFDFASAGIGAECTAARSVLGIMKVGSEPIEVADPDDAGGTDDGGGTTSASGSLPQTGGGDSLPVVGLWALALTLLGAAGLLCVPRARRQPR